MIDALLAGPDSVRVAFRQDGRFDVTRGDVDVVRLPGPGTNSAEWFAAVSGCDVVIHLAGLAHVSRSTGIDAYCAIRLANVDFAKACAKAAGVAGVQRFIFLSSIGVYGLSSSEEIINCVTPIRPRTLYSKSKASAEVAIAEALRGTDTQLVVVRAPLVYGFGARGKFDLLARAVKYRVPLPFSLLKKNRRSFVSIENLVSLLQICIDHPAAVNQTFLVSDGEDLSTAELLRSLGDAIGKPSCLFPFPLNLMEWVAKLTNTNDIYQSLCGSLQVDISETRKILGWRPVQSINDGLRNAVRGTK